MLAALDHSAIAVELEDFKRIREEAKRRQIEAGEEGKDFGVLGGRGKKKPLEEIIPEGVLDEGNVDRKKRESRSRIAATYGTNPSYIDRAAKLKEKRPDLHQQVKTGELTIPKAIQQLKAADREERQQKPPSANNCGRGFPLEMRRRWGQNVGRLKRGKMGRRVGEGIKNPSDNFIGRVFRQRHRTSQAVAVGARPWGERSPGRGEQEKLPQTIAEAFSPGDEAAGDGGKRSGG
jgi:hypothetical protein